MNLIVALAAFLASAVEFVEAFTIVLVVGITVNWRTSLTGALLAALALAGIVATLGVTLVTVVPIQALRLGVGVLLVLFGMRWLKKAILRYAGLKALHDEEAIFEHTMAELRQAGGVPQRIHAMGLAMAFKAVLLEGLEVAFIVITFGSTAATSTCGKSCSLSSAALGAVAAGLLVVVVGAMVRHPLRTVPENTLKFAVGIMLTSFGTFWAGEGVGVVWPLSDAAIAVLVLGYIALSYLLVRALRRHPSVTPPAAVSVPLA